MPIQKIKKPFYGESNPKRRQAIERVSFALFKIKNGRAKEAMV
jgi:hypothetical protein